MLKYNQFLSTFLSFSFAESRKLGLFLVLCLLPVLVNSQTRWERVYQHFPNERETAFGVLPTLDGGLFMLASSSQAQSPEDIVYLTKTDQDGTPLYTRNIASGRALKMKALTDSTIAIFYRKKPLTDSVEFRYALVDQTGTVLIDKPIDPTAVDASKKMWDFAPIHSGNPVVQGGFAVPFQEKFPINNTQLKIAFVRKDGIQQNALVLGTSLNADSVTIRSIIQAADSNFYAVGFVQNLDSLATADADPLWFKVSYDGTINQDSLYNEPPNVPAWIGFEMWHDIAQRPDGKFWVLSVQSSLLGPDFSKLAMILMDNQGNIIQKDTIDDHISNLEFAGEDHSEIIPMADGGAVVLYDRFTPGVNEEDIALTRIDANGHVLWTHYYGRSGRFSEAPFGIAAMPNGGYVACGVFKDLLFNSVKSYMIRTDSLGFVFTNYVQGRVFADLDADCIADANEPSLGGWAVSVERPGQTVFETITDANGYYLVPTDTGQVSVRILPPAPYWEPCSAVLSASMSVPFDTVTLDFGIKNIGECPQLEVDIATSFLRRCFKNYYYVSYANRGTKDVQNTSVQVQLDPDINFYGASIPLTFSLGKLLSFDIGDLPIGAIGQFQIEVEVDCDSPLGATHCTTAHIFPDTTCAPQIWSGATIEVDGTCKMINNSVEFKVRNTGNQSNATTVDYIIIEDHVLFRQGQIGNLPPGTDTTILIPANGKTYRLETSQEPGSPGPTNPAVSVEACGDSLGLVSTGYVTIFPNDDGNPFEATECLENIGSFDPNDKTANPRGYNNEHYVFPNTPLEYKIRFQNTGTDTAFAVVIRDTLSPFLDLRTLVPGAASHPYEMSILDNRTLKFCFNNIMLPDSNVNEPLSHGFVQFSIRHVPNIPLGTRIDNSAAIYFDFNEPVITNNYHLTVDTGFLDIKMTDGLFNPSKNQLTSLEPVPNPMRSFSIVGLGELTALAEGKDLVLELYSLDGRLVQRLLPSGLDYFKIQRGRLQAGHYVLSLKADGRAVGFGRLLVE